MVKVASPCDFCFSFFLQTIKNERQQEEEEEEEEGFFVRSKQTKTVFGVSNVVCVCVFLQDFFLLLLSKVLLGVIEHLEELFFRHFVFTSIFQQCQSVHF